MIMKVPSQKTQICRVILEVLGFLILVYPMAHIYVFLKGTKEPFQHGFYCDDENLKHPNLPETFTTTECFGIWATICVIIIISLEVLLFVVYKPTAHSGN
jgi:hypothetical protein